MDKSIFTKYRPKFDEATTKEPNLLTVLQYWYLTGLRDPNDAKKYAKRYVEQFTDMVNGAERP